MLGAKMSPEKRMRGWVSLVALLTAVRNLAAPPTGSTPRLSTLYTSLKWTCVMMSSSNYHPSCHRIIIGTGRDFSALRIFAN